MSQHDLEIANQSGAAARADINNALQALASLSGNGSSLPSTTFANQLAAVNSFLYQRNTANTAWDIKGNLTDYGFGLVTNNAYYDGSTWKYTANGPASRIEMTNGTVVVKYAATGTADTAITWASAMTIDNSGRVAMPGQPAWFLRPHHSSASNYDGFNIFPFATTASDAWAQNVTVTTGGRVTVPVAGKYTAVATVRQENSSGNYEISIKRNGSVIHRAGIWDSSEVYESIHATAIVDLAASDYLEIQIYSNASVGFGGSSDTTNIFSGHLIG